MRGAADRAYTAVRESIVTGTAPAGARLQEEVLAASIGVSRTPVREALRRLHTEGLVEVSPHRGAAVAQWGYEELDEIFELRTILEGYSARRAAEHVTAGQVIELQALCSEMDDRRIHLADRGYDEITKLNLRFHHIVHAASTNKRLLTLLPEIIKLPLVRHTFYRYTDEELTRSFAHHRELVNAMVARDPAWAESVMRSHVSASRASLRRVAGIDAGHGQEKIQ